MTTEQVLHEIYREESGKIISVLTKIFGATNLNLAEDVMQEAYIEALENWGNEIPKNPTAWIYSVARNKALPNTTLSRAIRPTKGSIAATIGFLE